MYCCAEGRNDSISVIYPGGLLLFVDSYNLQQSQYTQDAWAIFGTQDSMTLRFRIFLSSIPLQLVYIQYVCVYIRIVSTIACILM